MALFSCTTKVPRVNSDVYCISWRSLVYKEQCREELSSLLFYADALHETRSLALP